MPPNNIPKHQSISANQSAQLNSLRGASAIAVVLGHANQILLAPAYDTLAPWMGLLAQSGVMIFFVLSGFLICKSINNNIAKNGGVFSLPNYFSDRALRIWPPLIFSLLLLLILYEIAPFIFPSGSHHFLPTTGNELVRTAYTFETHELFGALFFLNGFFTNTPSANGPLWSLSIEIWYYLMAAIIAYPRGRWKLLTVPLLLGIIYIGRGNQPFLYYLCVWWAGYLLGIAHNRTAIPPAKYVYIAMIGCFTVAFALGAQYIIATYKSEQIANSFWLIAYFNISIGLGFCAALALVLKDKIRIPLVTSSTAAYSYTLYIIHAPIMLLVLGVTQSWIQSSVLNSLIILFITVISIIYGSKIAAKLLENKKFIKLLLNKRATYLRG